MAIFKCKIRGTAPLGFSRALQTPKGDGETHDGHEKKYWIERAHADEDGRVYIPAMAFKLMMQEAAKRYSLKIAGEGKKTYTKLFESGVFVVKHGYIGLQVEELEKLSLFVPSDGKRGGTAGRVWKYFPVANKWGCEVEFHIIHPKITEEIFERHLKYASLFVGLLMSRPAQRGDFGRFEIISHEWIPEPELEDLVSFLGPPRKTTKKMEKAS